MTASAERLSRFVRAENFCLRRFNEPVAIVAPEKFVESLRYLVEFVFAIRLLDCAIVSLSRASTSIE